MCPLFCGVVGLVLRCVQMVHIPCMLYPPVDDRPATMRATSPIGDRVPAVRAAGLLLFRHFYQRWRADSPPPRPPSPPLPSPPPYLVPPSSLLSAGSSTRGIGVFARPCSSRGPPWSAGPRRRRSCRRGEGCPLGHAPLSLARSPLERLRK